MLSIDQGTSSTRCSIIDRSGRLVQQSQKEHRQYHPEPGWVEHDPLEILSNTLEVIKAAMESLGVSHHQIVGVGITNQRETVVVWDLETGVPIYPAVVWQDTRTDAICSNYANEAERIRDITGLPLSTYFSAPKLCWILDHVPGARARALRGEICFGTIDTWLIWNLADQRHATDPTNASRTQLMNLRTLDWDQDLLDLFEIPRAMLPEILSSSEVYGRCSGMLEGVPLCGVLGDQQASLLGQGGFHLGDAKNTYGTGCFALINTGHQIRRSSHGMISTVAYRLANSQPLYALEGSVAVAGSLIQWLRDNLGLINCASEVEALALEVPDNGGVYIVPAFSGLFAPHWRPDARGIIVGLTAYVNRAHLARAALEATAHQSREVLDAMALDTGVHLKALRVDGGMVVNQTLMQIQADILGMRVTRAEIKETTSLGAAFCAGLAVGFWKDADEIRGLCEEGDSYDPMISAGDREHRHRCWLKAVSHSLGWIEGASG